jgi:AcrR family transcriptional regulator
VKTPRRQIGTSRRSQDARLIPDVKHVSLLPVTRESRRILEAAVALAEEGGFDGLRQRELAAKAGVALGTLYKRFKGKQDILAAALELEAEKLENYLRAAPLAGATPAERIGLFFGGTTRALCKKKNLARALLRAVASGEPELTEKVAAFHGRMTTLIMMALRGTAAFETDVRVTDDEHRVAFLLQQLWFASLVGWSGGLHSEAAVVEQMRDAAERLLYSMKKSA